jgi:hypothetical protein
MNKETGEIRELAEGEEPKPEEIVWEIGQPIENLDQWRLAKAVEKRLKRAAKSKKVCIFTAPNHVLVRRWKMVREAIKKFEER